MQAAIQKKEVLLYLLSASTALFATAHATGPARPSPQAPPPHNRSRMPAAASPIDTSPLPRPALGPIPYGIDIRTCTTPNKVALTFDDGPWKYTSDLLDLLSQPTLNGIPRATFFIVGNSTDHGTIDDPATGYPDVLRRMHAAGHQIGSHTWTHPDLDGLTTAGRRDEIIRNEAALASVLGFFPTYLRPPYTSCRAQCMGDVGALGYHIANYDVDTKDYLGDYAYAKNVYTGNITTASHASHIVLSHDTKNGTVYGFAQFMIDMAMEAGFELVTMGECLGDPVQNWYRDATTGGAWFG